MTKRRTIVGLVALLWLALAIFSWLSLMAPGPLQTVLAGPTLSFTAELAGDKPAIPFLARPLSPSMNVYNASSEQLTRLAEAIGSFGQAGLSLPPLDIGFDPARCDGARGLFTSATTPWQVWICSDDVESVISHELAHAWERGSVGETLRQTFMEQNGYTVWRSQAVPWNERAVEGIALVIQQGVSGLPLPPILGRDAAKRLLAFELLTGQPDPRLHDWLRNREVDCSDRPTPLSETIADRSGRTCI